MVKIRGKGTKLLSEKNVGDNINIIGPLGNGFPLIKTDKKIIFIAGGIGIAPFLYLSKYYNKPDLYLGIKNKDLLPDLEGFEKYCNLYLSSEDGSVGIKGNIIDLVKDIDFVSAITFVCGPVPMLKSLQDLFFNIKKNENIQAYFSLETYMGCGFGVCKGCAVKTSDGKYKLACTDGPVFYWNEINYEMD